VWEKIKFGKTMFIAAGIPFQQLNEIKDIYYVQWWNFVHVQFSI